MSFRSRLLRLGRLQSACTTNRFHGFKSSGQHTKNGKWGGAGGLVAAGALATGVAAAYTAYRKSSLRHVSPCILLTTVHAATAATPQPNVASQTKQHALYLWIHLQPDCNRRACAKVAATLQRHVNAVCPPQDADEDDEIWAGDGFGPNFLTQATGKKAEKNFNYPHRSGANGDLPSTGGDIFVHAKSNNMSKLFELTQSIMAAMPPGSVRNFEDIYSFVYKNGRDLSGFIDGTENPAADEDRAQVAVEKKTGGSYCITQRWVHKLDVISESKERMMEGWLGRSRPDSLELSRKTTTSHVARMTGGHSFNQKKEFEIVRQSMPYGNVSGEAGLFFIGFAESPDNFEFMLDRMVGASHDGLCDDVMRLTKCISGMYWYFPSMQELARMA